MAGKTLEQFPVGNNILVVDDEQPFLKSVQIGLQTSGFPNVHLESDPRNAAALFDQGYRFDVALLDVTMPYMNGMKLLELIKQKSPHTECLMLTALDKAKVAMDCLKKGAYDYLVKPMSKDELVLAINRALERKRLLNIVDLAKQKTPGELTHPEAFKPIVTGSEKMMRILKEAELHAASSVPVLITGESGTGKELLARAIHVASPRANYPFSAINMASLSPTLFDAEFFGHTKGAFTGAETNREGYLEHTHRGTLFLDEIGHLPLDLQGKLLRVLQEGEYFKLGTSVSRKTDVRIIAATNVDIDRLVDKGIFRLDLYYRLKCAWLHLPPLKERKEDIPQLISYFLRESEESQEVCQIEADAMAILQNYTYPGNIRELRSILQSAVNLSRGKAITVDSLPNHLPKHKVRPPVESLSGLQPPLLLEDVVMAHILKVYDQAGCNKAQAAKLLGIGLSTLRRKLASCGVE